MSSEHYGKRSIRSHDVSIDWERLQGIYRRSRLGAACKLAFIHLWWCAGNEPGMVRISTKELAADLGRDARCARDWLAALETEGLIAVEEHCGGEYLIEVYPLGSDAPREDPLLAVKDTR